MVNLNFIHLVFNKPDWVDDITAVKISKRVTKMDMEIGDILEQSDKHVIYKLLTKGSRGDYVLWIRKDGDAIWWNIGKRA